MNDRPAGLERRSLPRTCPSMDDIAHRIASAFADRYEVIGPAGQGGMSLVFRMRPAGGGPDVAIKVIRPELSTHLTEARFVREARIAEELDHPGIVPALEAGSVDGLLYLIMPFVEGQTLEKRLAQEGALGLDEAIRIVTEIGEALAYAHDRGFIHRDVKPGNIMLGPGGARIADFGIARALVTAAGERLTVSGVSIGTPRYMSPEQGAGDQRLDERSDEYALACVLYEMLVGEPPFTGPTAKAVIARHIAEPPPSIDVVRPDLPPGVAWSVRKALSKNAADRFPTVPEFIAALSSDPPAPKERRRRWMAAVAIVAALLATATLALQLLDGTPTLDPLRVLVFAPDDENGQSGVNDAVATYIGYVLEGTDPLRWEEARDWIEAGTDEAGLGLDARLSAARRARAGHFIDGSVLRSPDSVTVILRLFDARSGERIRTAGRSGPPGASEASLGAAAVAQLLNSLIEPGRPIDLGKLSERSPAAIARFYNGEVAYRMTRFDEALDQYEAAVAADSAFAIAAVKGAQAAGWLEDATAAADLAALAIANDSLLPTKYREFILGIRDYHAGVADSALAHLARTTSAFPEWAEGRTALAEVYYHLMPDRAGLDSLARTEFETARRLDSLFAPPLYHLAEMAIRSGELERARRLVDRLEAVSPDSVIEIQLDLMLQCATAGPATIDWTALTATDEYGVVSAAQAMAPSPALRPCASAAADAVVSNGSVRAWGGLLVLQSVLLADGRLDELRELLASDRVANLPADRLLLIDAVADPRLAPDADAVYASLGREFAAVSSPNLWLMLEWASASGRVEDVRDIAAVLQERASTGGRRDELFAAIAAAHQAMIDALADQALDRVAALRPTAPVAALLWDPWEALAPEILLRADLLIARDSTDVVRRSLLDAVSHRSVAQVLFEPLRNRLLAATRRADGS